MTQFIPEGLIDSREMVSLKRVFGFWNGNLSQKLSITRLCTLTIVMGWHHRYWYLGMSNNLISDTTECPALHSRPSVCAHNYQVDVLAIDIT